MKAVQEEHAADLVVKISRMDLDFEKGSFGIDQRLPLAAFDLLHHPSPRGPPDVVVLTD